VQRAFIAEALRLKTNSSLSSFLDPHSQVEAIMCSIRITSSCKNWPFSRIRRLSTSQHASVKDELGWVHEDNKIEVIRVVDSAKRAAQRWTSVATDFLSPSVQADCITALKSMASSDVGCVSFGGHANAERARLLVGRIDALPDLGLLATTEDSGQHSTSVSSKEETETKDDLQWL
jgi:hypothetical protein